MKRESATKERALNDEKNKLKTSNEQLKLKLVQAQKKIKDSDEDTEKLREKMHVLIEKEEKRKERDRKLLQECLNLVAPVQNMKYATKKTSIDPKLAEMIGIIEDQRSELEKEVQMLRQQVFEYEQELISHLESPVSTTPSVPTPKPTSATPPPVNPHNNTLFAPDQADKILRLEAQVSQLSNELEQYKQENTRLKWENDERPTVQKWKATVKELATLEKFFLDFWSQETETRDLMKRDKIAHKLKLSSIDDIPDSVLRTLVKTMCLELEEPSPSQLLPLIRNIFSKAKQFPLLEQVLSDVCHAVGTQFDWSSECFQTLLQKVVFMLKQLQELVSLQDFRDVVLEELKTAKFGYLSTSIEDNAAHPEQLPSVCSRMILAVRELVQYKVSHSLSSKEAEEELVNEPRNLVHKIIKHIQTLFQVESMEGVLPKMNQIFVTINETKNGLDTLRLLLRLEETASWSACLSFVKYLMDKKMEANMSQTPEKDKVWAQLSRENPAIKDLDSLISCWRQ